MTGSTHERQEAVPVAPSLQYATAAMTKASNDIETAHADLASMQNAMNGINQDLGAGWYGGARSAFVSTYEAFESAYTSMNNALSALSENLSTARNVLGTTDANAASSAQGVMGAING
jgi:WXG100 family type VII secretion target